MFANTPAGGDENLAAPPAIEQLENMFALESTAETTPALEELDGVVECHPTACEKGSVADSKPKELYPYMPVLHLLGRTVADAVPETMVTTGRYICPFYTTTVRGPTYVFAGPLRTNVDAKKW
ncbi:MAG: hypothetical protein VXY90_13765, partial [Pseudomonadota bacterium]|nr:hypothetical protein [Pseudomonadota bacterium]MEC8585836.1 hypothetical protein [Pseudomonadota bacterium]